MKKEKLNWSEMKNSEKFKVEQIRNSHKSKLGFDSPPNYFAQSKQSILEQIQKESEKKPLFLFSKTRYWLPIAAAVALLISVTVFNNSALPFFDKTQEIVLDTLNQIEESNLANKPGVLDTDVSLAVLFVDDENVNEFIDSYVLEDTIDKELMLN